MGDEEAFRLIAHEARLQASLARDKLASRGVIDPAQWAAVIRATAQANQLCSMYPERAAESQQLTQIVAASSRKVVSTTGVKFEMPLILRDLPPYAVLLYLASAAAVWCRIQPIPLKLNADDGSRLLL